MTRWSAMFFVVLASMARTHAATDAAPLPCLRPVPGVTWVRWEHQQPILDLWCRSVGPPVFMPALHRSGVISRLLVLSWNLHVGGGDIEQLVGQLLDLSDESTGLVVLAQEAFRSGAEVPDLYPRELRAPSSIRPRRPVPDIVGIAERFGLWVAYVPSMRNGEGKTRETREDRGNAVLSTEPLSDIRAIELPFGKQRRVAVAATVAPRTNALAPMRVVAAHFDPNGNRASQAEALSGRMASLGELPIVIGADLNARRGFRDRTVTAVSQQASLESCGTGRTHRWPWRLDVLLFFLVGRLDYMFSTLDGSVDRTCRTLSDAYDSDHLPLLLDVRVR